MRNPNIVGSVSGVDKYLEKKPKRGPAKTPRPCCRACGKKLRRAPAHLEARGRGEWGDYGDTFFCGLTCGYIYAVRIVRAAQAQK